MTNLIINGSKMIFVITKVIGNKIADELLLLNIENLPTILSPSRNKAVAENAPDKTLKNGNIKTGKDGPQAKFHTIPDMVIIKIGFLNICLTTLKNILEPFFCPVLLLSICFWISIRIRPIGFMIAS